MALIATCCFLMADSKACRLVGRSGGAKQAALQDLPQNLLGVIYESWGLLATEHCWSSSMHICMRCVEPVVWQPGLHVVSLTP